MAWSSPRTWVAAETLTAALLNAELRDNLNAAFPVGSLHWRMQAATTSETTIDGMLLEANAISVLRATYSALNTKLSGLSYPFGTVDGTHMTLPDLQGRGPQMMSSGGHADVNALGDSDGVTKASRTPKATIAAHTHSETAHTHSTPAHSHSLTTGSVTLPGGAFSAAPGAQGVVVPGTLSLSGSSASDGSSTTGSGGGGTTGSGGGATVSGAFLVVGVIGVKYRPTL